MVYEWKARAILKCNAQDAGEVCEELQKTVGLTAKNLVDASRDEKSKLHGEFEWDDAVAGEKYRETQAGYIIRNLTVVVEDNTEEFDESIYEPTENSTVMKPRAFFKLSDSKEYEPIKTIMENPVKRTSLLDMALSELRAFRKKYATLKELAGVFEEIEKLDD